MRINSTEINVVGAPPADGSQTLLEAGIEGDVLKLSADKITTGATGLLRARLPFDNTQGSQTSVPGMTLIMSPTALTVGGGFGLATPNGYIQVRIGNELGGYLTVRPRGVSGDNAFILLAGPDPKPFYDGNGKLTEVRVFYNGDAPRTPQESGALTAVTAIVEDARQTRFEEAVRTENVKSRLRSGVIAEVGAGRPATVGRGVHHAAAELQPEAGVAAVRVNPGADAPDATRRALAALPFALAGLGALPAALAQSAPGSVRLALLIGNRVYPSPHDLPPVHKNIRDLTAALERRDFKVTSAVDLEPPALRQAIQTFAAQARQAPADATVLFYFTGHGMQVDAENLMLGAGIAPNAREDTLLGSSLHLTRDVVDQLPKRSTGLSIAVVDACRVDLRAAVRASDGFNQVEAPPGCLIVFSTAAGKPAIASAKETENTFYTASLVKLLQSGSDELSFSDLFRLVKLDVQQTMLSHPIPVIRQFAQVPFIAENTQVRFRLSPKPEFDAPRHRRPAPRTRRTPGVTSKPACGRPTCTSSPRSTCSATR